MGKRTHSIKLILSAFSAFVLVIAALTVVYIVAISNKKMREQIALANRSSLQVISDEIDKTLLGVDGQFFSLPYNMFSSPEGSVESKANLSSYLRNIALVYPLVNGLWYYIPDSNEFVVSTAGVSSMDESNMIIEALAPRIHSYGSGTPVESSRWRLEEISGVFYLTRMLEADSSYCGAWIRIESMSRKLNMRKGAYLVFNAANGDEFSGRLTFHKFEPEPSDGLFAFIKGLDDKSYLAVTVTSQAGDFWVSYLVQESFDLSSQIDADADILTVALAAIVAVILFLVGVEMLRRLIYRPLNLLQGTMGEVRQGNFSPTISNSRLSEFQRLNQTFEYMLKEIRALKIDVYEQRLDRQRIEQRFLQIQLKSHFYLNCLNIIHSLAQVNNYSLIQDLTRSLGAYFRYMADDFSKVNTLSEELEHLRNYMHIQEIRFPNRLKYAEEVPPELLFVRIPPLVLQTFVENSVEHAIDLDKDNLISVTATAARAEPDKNLGIEVCIIDNGKGFSVGQLERFNAFEKAPVNPVNIEDGIGIRNVINRLELIYGGEATVRFSNAPQGGAVVRIWFPIMEKAADDDV